MAGQLLAQPGVGHAIDGSLVHRWVLVDCGFDLDAVNVFAAAQDHVLCPIAHVDETLIVDAANIAGAQPSVLHGFCRGFGTVPVFRDQHGALEPDLAGLAGGEFLTVGVGDPNSHDWYTLAGRRWVLDEHRASVLWAVRIGLGHAITQTRAAVGEVIFDALHQLRWHRGTPASNRFEGRSISAGETWRLEQVPAHRGYTHKVGHSFRLDELKSPLRVPAVCHDQLGTAHERTEHDWHQASDMEQRHTQHEHRRTRWSARIGGTGSVTAVWFGEPADGSPSSKRQQRAQHGAMGGDSTLRMSRSARRVQDGNVVISVDLDRRHFRIVDKRVLEPSDAIGKFAIRPHSNKGGPGGITLDDPCKAFEVSQHDC